MSLALTILLTVLVSAAVWFPILLAFQHPELVTGWYRRHRNRYAPEGVLRSRSLQPSEPNEQT